MLIMTLSNLLSFLHYSEHHLDIWDNGVQVRKGACGGFRRVSLNAWGYIALFLMLLLSFAPPCLAQTSIITTYAGPSLPTDGAQATTQAFDYPTSVIPDGVGGFYFSDPLQNRIYRVAADGTLNLVAGSTFGFSGDGGPATSAQLSRPWGVAVDAGGNLYIADTYNGRIRKVTPAGVISTVAGNGSGGFAGDGGPATSAQIGGPFSVAVDAGGNLYIADTFNNRIRKVTPAGVINTIAGNGTGGFAGDGGPATSAQVNSPQGVAVDTGGNLYIADSGSNRVRKVTPAGVISTVAGNGTQGFSGDGGPATSAELISPLGVATDAGGNLYIADGPNLRIRKVTPAGVISTVAGNGSGFSGDGGPATSAGLNYPHGVAVDAGGNLYIADSDDNRIRKVTPAGVISTVAGNGTAGFAGDGGPATSAELNAPFGVAVDAGGNLYIADTVNYRIRKVTVAGVISTVAGNGTCCFSGDGGPATSAQLNLQSGVALDAGGNLYIADTNNNRIRKVTPAGVISTVAGNGTQGFGGDGGPATSAQLALPYGVAVDAGGNLYLADTFNNRARKVTPAGVISTIAGNGTSGFSGDGGPATSAELHTPFGVAVDAGGNLYIADSSNNRVRKVTPAGVISTVAGNGTSGFSGDGGPATSARLSNPTGVAVDAGGNLYIADYLNQCIRKVTSAGVINTVAGNGLNGFSGDGGPAISAQLNYPTGVAVDAGGNLYIADLNNARIRTVTPSARSSIGLTLSSGGGATTTTIGSSGPVQAGYGVVATNSGASPYGTAVFSFSQNNVVVSETGVPASAPTTRARIFIDFRTAVAAKSDQLDVGSINIDTGFAIVNRGSSTANVSYNLRDINGNIIALGSNTMAAGAHDARFIDQLGQVAPGFVIPPNFAGFGALDIIGDQPLSVVALRLTTNQRNETLITTTPIADLNATLSTDPLYFAQVVDGGGYKTTFLFLDTSSITESGTVQFFTDSGTPFSVTLTDGRAGSSIAYTLQPGGYAVMQTSGTPANQNAGWAVITRTAGNTPVVAGVFGFTQGGILVTESGIPSASATTHARIYVDRTVTAAGTHDTGLAIVNPTQFQTLTYTVNAFQMDGVTPVGSGGAQPTLNGYGHVAKFAEQFVSGLASGFTGVLDISAPAPFAALTLRSLNNGRGDFLLTTFPIADATQVPPNPLIFPQIADGGGFQTQFILLGVNGAASTTLGFFGGNGSPLGVGKNER